MPVSTWKPRDEQQYRAIVRNCRSDLKTCKRVAAATVNKRRARGLGGLGFAAEQHSADTVYGLARLRTGRPQTCKDATKALILASRVTSSAEASEVPSLIQAAERALSAAKTGINFRCVESSGRHFTLEGLEKAEYMLTRGFKDGKKSWIDVLPTHGPKMRVTHEILEGLGERERWKDTPPEKKRAIRNLLRRWRRVIAKEKASGWKNTNRSQAFEREHIWPAFRELNLTDADVRHVFGIKKREDLGATTPPPLPSAALRKCIAWRYVGTSRRCALFADETGFRTAKPPVIPPKRPLLFGPLDGLEGTGSSFAMMWAAAGAVALVVLSDSAKENLTPRVKTAEQQAVFDSLNRARITQGLPPLTR